NQGLITVRIDLRRDIRGITVKPNLFQCITSEMSVRRHHSPDNKQFVNIILTQRTSLLIVQIAGCEARHSFFSFYP
ncbi:hypothetical protein QP417_17765, partial [Enterobacter hormaechei]